ncbi:MAG: cell division protein FtsL [Gammaproteobacteria bacterium]|nr:cell division protein FtsL [Gammaproteobacteria bacterium]MDE1887792.1 cell division protein FtsL [Gammaproteobacteria bacterium]MDE2022713.1 cell division protein FtsL [Gammaproteobacteria bacterium]MDE2140008.1 cell division protein FtsL [Gammaproteobacteria bacterium]MDE2273258.1 cell division protein FtsL [Gammaproteobacteria bacterium]
MRFTRAILALLLAAVLLSALAVIDARHENRMLFAQLQQLRQQRDQQNVEWGQLLLEQSTWSTHARVEQMATQKLDMHLPAHPRIVVVHP